MSLLLNALAAPALALGLVLSLVATLHAEGASAPSVEAVSVTTSPATTGIAGEAKPASLDLPETPEGLAEAPLLSESKASQGTALMLTEIQPDSRLFGVRVARISETAADSLQRQFLEKNLTEYKDLTGARFEALIRSLSSVPEGDSSAGRERNRRRRADKVLEWLHSFATDKLIDLRGLHLDALFVRLRRLALLDPDAEVVREEATRVESALLSLADETPRDPWVLLTLGLARQMADVRQYPTRLKKRAMDYLAAASLAAVKDSQLHYVLGLLYRSHADRDSLAEYLKLVATELEKSLLHQRRNKELFTEITSIYVDVHESIESQGAEQPFWFEELVYRRIIQLDPSNVSAHNNLSYLYSQYGVNLKEALREAQIATQLSPDNASTLDTLGWALYKNDQTEKAVETLSRAVELSPDDPDVHFHLATVYYDLDRTEETIQHFRETLRLDPENAFALNNLAYLFSEKGIHLEEGLSLVDRALALQPGNAAFLDTKGWLLYKLRQYGQALTFLQQAVDESPETSELQLHLGRVHMTLGNLERAIKAFEMALHNDPENRTVARELATLFALHGLQEALERFSSIAGVTRDKTNLKVFYDAMANLSMAAGDYEGAVQHLRNYANLPASGGQMSAPPMVPLTAGPGGTLQHLGRVLPRQTDMVLSLEPNGLSRLIESVGSKLASHMGVPLPEGMISAFLPERLCFALFQDEGQEEAELLTFLELSPQLYDQYELRLGETPDQPQEVTLPVGNLTVPFSFATTRHGSTLIREMTIPQGTVHLALLKPYILLSVDRKRLEAVIDAITAGGPGISEDEAFEHFSSSIEGPVDAAVYIPFGRLGKRMDLPEAYGKAFARVASFGATYEVGDRGDLVERSMIFPVKGSRAEEIQKDLEDLLEVVRKDIQEKFTRDVRVEATFEPQGDHLRGVATIHGFQEIVSKLLSQWYKLQLPGLDLIVPPPADGGGGRGRPIGRAFRGGRQQQ